MYADHYLEGKALRKSAPRSAHQQWKPVPDRAEVVQQIALSSVGRIPELIPERYKRMSKSPFVFYRATAGIMAKDLSVTPNSGIMVQSCGDCHFMNFGAYINTDGNVVFDLNDFDETHYAPWEWDVKRLAVSFALAARHLSISRKGQEQILAALIRSYKNNLRYFSQMKMLDLWYLRFDASSLTNQIPQRRIDALFRHETKSSFNSKFLLTIKKNIQGHFEIQETPPLIMRPHNIHETKEFILAFNYQYNQTLEENERMLIGKFELKDVVFQVMGVGSVGTRCYACLLMNENDEPLFIQLKEAHRSALEQFTQPSKFEHQGERIVKGQRCLQSLSDLFLGWCTGPEGRHYYLKQLREKKIIPGIEEFDAVMLSDYAQLCGRVLARAHAKSSQGARMCGYIGKSEQFDLAIIKFSASYADQTIKDYETFMTAMKEGKLALSQSP